MSSVMCSLTHRECDAGYECSDLPDDCENAIDFEEWKEICDYKNEEIDNCKFCSEEVCPLIWKE